MIRKPAFHPITAHYEVFEDQDSDAPVGKASVTEGFIESLLIRDDAGETYRGQILGRLLRAILEDADRNNCNVSIKIAAVESVRMKRFFERFGFSETPAGVYNRAPGSLLPPSVLY